MPCGDGGGAIKNEPPICSTTEREFDIDGVPEKEPEGDVLFDCDGGGIR